MLDGVLIPSTVTQALIRPPGAAARGTAAYEVLRPLMIAAQTGSLTAERFYWEVTRAYHDAEAPVYDRLHGDLFRSLLPKWRRLVAPLRHLPSRSIRWLDVGCGTGLVGAYLSELLGVRISAAFLVDPSAAMIDRCRERATQWPFDCAFLAGTIEEIPRGEGFDLITVNSVLHHVVTLEVFCRHLPRLARAGGYLITCQDPRGEGLADQTLRRRVRLASGLNAFSGVRSAGRAAYGVLQRLPQPLPSLATAARRMAGRISPPARPRPGESHPATVSAVIGHTNQLLLERGVVGRALSARELWAVTDVHVPDQPGSVGAGITLRFLVAALRAMRLEEYFTYAYFGATHPRPALRSWEDRLSQQGDPHGSLFASRWRRL